MVGCDGWWGLVRLVRCGGGWVLRVVVIGGGDGGWFWVVLVVTPFSTMKAKRALPCE